ncbi:MAG: helix-turn-helix domain-containing protein [Ignavibacteriae bacterium]|nr:helix-turn-helix domain-containing protein [Ignavibacteriota bacterium]
MKQEKKQNELLEKLTSIEALLKKRNDKPLNFNQAAEYLGFSYSYLYKLTSRKIIPCHRPTGKVLFFSKDELDEWIFSKSKVKGEKLNKKSEEEHEDDTSTALSDQEEYPP